VAGRITLKMLATHTSGLPRTPPNQRRGPDGNVTGYTVADLVAFLERFRPRYPPGTHYAYSNIGFGLLGFVLGHAAGTSWAALVARDVTGPLGMADTVVSPSGGQLARTATGYRQTRPVAPLVTPSFLGGGGALRSTAADMLAFLRAEIEPAGQPRGLASGIALTQRGYFALGRGRSEGLAWTLVPLGVGGFGLSKNGATQGFSAIMSFAPSTRRGAFIVANRSRASNAIDPAVHRMLGFGSAPTDEPEPSG
jgi:beta-lactamase class C